jgi:hypothetical protein
MSYRYSSSKSAIAVQYQTTLQSPYKALRQHAHNGRPLLGHIKTLTPARLLNHLAAK